MPTCVDCGDDHPDPDSHIGIGTVDGLIIMYVYGMPVLLDPEQGEAMVEHLKECVHIARWTNEIGGGYEWF